MKSRSKIGIVVVSVGVISSILVLYLSGDLFLLSAPIASTYAALSLLLFSGEEEGADGKKRVVADFYSHIPGAGHLYLGKRKRSIPFFLTVAAAILSLLLMIPYPTDAAYIFFVMFFLTLLYVSLISLIDVDRLCDEMGLPYKDSTEEVHVPEINLEYFIVTAAAASAVFLITSYLWFFDWNADRNAWIYMITGTVWFSVYIVSMFDLRKYNHIPWP
jgi:hypothetical protein